MRKRGSASLYWIISSGLFYVMNVLADFIHNRLAALCEYLFIFCDQIITMGIDRDDERAKLFDSAYP